LVPVPDPSRLADFLFGRRSARRSLLETLLSDPSERIHLRELARRTGFSAPMVAKELERLVADHVVLERREGRTRTFQANLRSPIAEDLGRITGRPSTERHARAKRATPASGEGLAHGRPRTLREAAARGASLGRRDAMLREFLDEFYQAPAPRRAAMLADEPALIADDDRANAYYAAVAEHLAFSHALKVPAWALDRRRFLRKPFFPAGLESLKATLIAESPSAFRRRMIFVGGDPLYRPRRASPPRSHAARS
jgi:hypothetical protein